MAGFADFFNNLGDALYSATPEGQQMLYQQESMKRQKLLDDLRVQQAQQEMARQKALASLAGSGDVGQMLQGAAQVDPGAYLGKYAQFLQEQQQPKMPETKGLPEGYMWQNVNGQYQAIPVPGYQRQQKPTSPLGKLKSDLDAGLITPEQYKAAVTKETTGGASAKSKLGKLKSDLEAGLITPDEYQKEAAGSQKYREGEMKAASFGNMMQQSSKLLDELEGQGEVVSKTAAALESVIPSWAGGQAAANTARNELQQKYKNAADSWIRAKLRKESGAAIGAQEAEQEYRTFFPVPGDTPEVIAQKKNMREEANKAMIAESGGAYQSLFAPKQTGQSDVLKSAIMKLQKKLGK